MKEMMDLLFKIPFEQRAKQKSPKNRPSYSTPTLASTTLGDLTTTTWEYDFSTITTSTISYTSTISSSTRSAEKVVPTVDGASEEIERWDWWNQVIRDIFPGMAHWIIDGIFMSFYVDVCHFCLFSLRVRVNALKCLFMFLYPSLKSVF